MLRIPFKAFFERAIEGQIFTYYGERWLKVTGIVALNLDTDDRLFLGIDF